MRSGRPLLAFPQLMPGLARELTAAAEPGLVLPAGIEAWAIAAARAPDLNFVARAGFGLHAGRIVGAGGVIPDHLPRATAWFMIDPSLPDRALALARRKARDVIASAHAQGWRRIEAQVHERFPAGCRFAERLGFELEGHSPCWLACGAGVFTFARIDPPLQEEVLE
jgi:hypothetical protein